MNLSETQAYTRDFLRTYAATILDLANRTGATGVRVFGSFATGTATERSDLDLLVDVPPDSPQKGRPVDIDLAARLEIALDREVEVVRSDQIFHLLRPRILKEARPLESLLGDNPDWSPVFPKDPRHHLWLLAYWLEKIHSVEKECAGLPERIARWEHLRYFERLSARLEKLPEADRARFPGLPWEELEALIEPFRRIEQAGHEPPGDEPMDVSLTAQKAGILAAAIRAILPDDETLAKEIAGDSG